MLQKRAEKKKKKGPGENVLGAMKSTNTKNKPQKNAHRNHVCVHVLSCMWICIFV